MFLELIMMVWVVNAANANNAKTDNDIKFFFFILIKIWLILFINNHIDYKEEIFSSMSRFALHETNNIPIIHTVSIEIIRIQLLYLIELTLL